MFAVIYRFEVKPNQQEKFVSAWTEMTELIKKHEGGLGSRLHRETDRIYIAYAQWPSKEMWENFGDKLPFEAKVISQQMKDACLLSETIHTLEMTDDLLTKI